MSLEVAMKDYQQRVVTEKAELYERIAKLEKFQDGEDFFRLCDEDERIRMINQLNAMYRYNEVLGQRIAAFK
jgi:hypothetical protein